MKSIGLIYKASHMSQLTHRRIGISYFVL